MDDFKPQKPHRPTLRYWLPIGGTVLVLALVAAVVVRRERDGAEAVPAQQQAAAIPTDSGDVIEATPDQLKQIQVAQVREQIIATDLETTGKIGFDEDRMAPVFAPYGGRVLEILANKGDIVVAGQPLLIVDSADLVAAVSDLSEARASVYRAKIDMDTADKAAQRARTLNAQEALATRDLQTAESDLARFKEEYRRALAAEAVVRNRLAMFGKSPEEIEQLETKVTDQMDRRVAIRAPLAGTIVDRKVGPGQYIKPDNPDPLYLISDLSNVWVNADVYENSLPQIKVGAPAEITVAAYPGRIFPAHITAINPTMDPATRTIHVRCLVSNPGGLLKPEMFATLSIGSTVKRTVITIPTSAVVTQGTDSFVLVELSNGRFRRNPVTTGRQIQDYTVVESGLSATDRVITGGAALLSNKSAPRL